MIRIYGHSDDLIEIEGRPSRVLNDEISFINGIRTITVVPRAERGGLRVLAEYGVGDLAVWRLSVEPIDEGQPIPWPVRIVTAENGYGCAVEIDADPRSVILTHDGDKED